MEKDDDRRLWDLLGKSPAPAISPFFARNVTREIRGSARTQRRLSWHLFVSLGAAAAIAVGTFIAFRVATPIFLRGDAESVELVAEVDALFEPEDDPLADDLLVML